MYVSLAVCYLPKTNHPALLLFAHYCNVITVPKQVQMGTTAKLNQKPKQA